MRTIREIEVIHLDLKIEDLRKICRIENIEITLHAAKRLEQRGITSKDILACIQNGTIIEQYPNDYPYPSSLILGLSFSGQIIHVVIGTDMQTLWIITAYYPSSDKWESDFRTRKEQ